MPDDKSSSEENIRILVYNLFLNLLRIDAIKLPRNAEKTTNKISLVAEFIIKYVS